jgi:hypothetical protein
MNLNFEAENGRYGRKQRGAGFPACRFAGLSSPALERLESRSNWQTRMSAQRQKPCHLYTNFGIEDKACPTFGFCSSPPS